MGGVKFFSRYISLYHFFYSSLRSLSHSKSTVTFSQKLYGNFLIETLRSLSHSESAVTFS